MPLLTARQLPGIWEEPDSGAEAVVLAAIRLLDWVETNLRRLAAGVAPGSGSKPIHDPSVHSRQRQVKAAANFMAAGQP